MGREVILENCAVMLLLALGPAEQSCSGCVLEHFPDALAGLGRAFQIMFSTNLLRDCHTLGDMVNGYVRER